MTIYFGLWAIPALMIALLWIWHWAPRPDRETAIGFTIGLVLVGFILFATETLARLVPTA